MSLRGQKAVGDDQAWKSEAEKEFAELRKEIAALKAAQGRVSKAKK